MSLAESLCRPEQPLQVSCEDNAVFVRTLLVINYNTDCIVARACRRGQGDDGTVASNRRDIFPMPQISRLEDVGVDAPSHMSRDMILAFVNASTHALSCWSGYKPRTITDGYRNAVQRRCLYQWVADAVPVIGELSKVKPDDLTTAPPTLSKLDASRVDVLDRCEDVETLQLMPRHVQDVLADGAKHFPYVTPTHAMLPSYHGNTRERALLISRQLRGRRFRLRLDVKGGGPCSFVSKPGRSAPRRLWYGHSLSGACVPIFPPRHHANPSTFVHLRASEEAPLFLSTEIARTGSNS